MFLDCMRDKFGQWKHAGKTRGRKWSTVAGEAVFNVPRAKFHPSKALCLLQPFNSAHCVPLEANVKAKR